jgi:hypothetical protein
MLFAHEILEEGIDMHRTHPSFESYAVLLYFLCDHSWRCKQSL